MSNLNFKFKFGVISLSRQFVDELHYCYFEDVFKELKVQCPNIDVRRIVLESIECVSHTEKECMRNVDILLTDPGVFINKEVFNCLDNIKWIQMFTAGVEAVTKYYAEKLPPKFLLSRNAGFFDSQMVQYVMGHILSKEGLFQQYKTLQGHRIWKNLCCRPLHDLAIGIVGYGSVGSKIAEFAMSYGMKVLALIKKEKQIDVEHKNITFTTNLIELLQSSDYIVSVLPNISNTNGFFDGNVLEQCRCKKSVFINIGRGNVIKEATIVKALNEGWISHAVLDVFEKEPLAPDSLLWERDDVTITPHVSGSHFMPNKFVEKVLANYKKFCEGRLTDVVDWSKGY